MDTAKETTTTERKSTRTKPAKAGAKTERAGRRTRHPISGRNDPLAVEGKDPNFYYRWVYDTSENGTAILKYKRAGYLFAQKSEGLIVGSSSVVVHEDVGSHVRVPAGRDGGYMFLMKLPKEYRQEDLEAKSQVVSDTEQALIREKPEGGYGEVKITR